MSLPPTTRSEVRENRRVRTISEIPSAAHNYSERGREAQLAEENLVLRTRIREMEGLPLSRLNGRRASTAESDVPPNYDEAGIAL